MIMISLERDWQEVDLPWASQEYGGSWLHAGKIHSMSPGDLEGMFMKAGTVNQRKGLG